MRDINPVLINELLKDYKKPAGLIGENGILKQFTKAILECALDSELTEHLGYEKNAREGRNRGNSRNGKTKKKLLSDHGDVDIVIPRDCNSDCEPQIVQKGQRLLPASMTRYILCTPAA